MPNKAIGSTNNTYPDLCKNSRFKLKTFKVQGRLLGGLLTIGILGIAITGSDR